MVTGVIDIQNMIISIIAKIVNFTLLLILLLLFLLGVVVQFFSKNDKTNKEHEK